MFGGCGEYLAVGARERRNENSVCRSALGGGFSVGLAMCQ